MKEFLRFNEASITFRIKFWIKHNSPQKGTVLSSLKVHHKVLSFGPQMRSFNRKTDLCNQQILR